MKVSFIYILMCITLFFIAYPANSFAKTNDIQQQNIVIKGVVTDKNGETLPAVSISVKDKESLGTSTDLDGAYTLSVPNEDAIIVVRYLGYKTQEVKVGKKTTIDFVLEEDTQLLDEVVVVGYGVQKKVNLTGAVTTVQTEKLESRATTTLSSSLSGLASGLTVRQSSGKPGSDGASINIRGIGTFASDYNSPLIIVDGSEASMGSVNAEDVESISVLKDAGSASIYGARGANGVILITTKKGKKGAPARVTYTGILTSEKMSGKAFRFENNYAEYMEMVNRFHQNTGGDLKHKSEEIEEWRNGIANPNGTYIDENTGNKVPNWLAYPSTDWIDYLFESATSQKHNVSVNGGSENSNYLMSFNYMDNPGMMRNTGLKRYSGRINLESKINKFLTIGTNTYGTIQKKEPGNTELKYMFQVLPNVVPHYNGQYGGSDDQPRANNLFQGIMSTGGSYDETRINTTWYAKLNLIEGLTADIRYNFQNTINEQATHGRKIDLVSFRSGNILNPGGEADKQSTTRATHRYRNSTATATLNYLKTFVDHDIAILAGTERYVWNYKGFWVKRYGLLDLDLPEFNSASDIQVPYFGTREDQDKRAEKDYSVISFFGRFNYSYKGKYLFEATVRRDGSSRFGSDHRWGNFPSFSAGWRISEESFMENTKDIISNLKLRLAWGKIGNTTGGYYDWQALYSQYQYSFGGESLNALAIKSLANSILHWEESTTTGIGFDLGLFNNKLNLEFDFYNRQTSNIITPPPMYLSMGNVGAPKTNTTDMYNRGIEFTAGWRDKINDFEYSISGNFSYNINRVNRYKGKLKEELVIDENGKRTWVSNLGDVAFQNGDRIRLEGHEFHEYYLLTMHKGNGNYFLADGSPDPNGGPRNGIIRTKEDMEWVKAMVAYVDPATGKKPYGFVNGSSSEKGGGLYYGEPIYADVNGDGYYGNRNDRRFTGYSQAPKYNFGLTLSAAWKGIDMSMTWAGQAGFKYLIYSRGFNDTKWQDGDILPANARHNFYYIDPALATDAGYDPTSDPNANINAKYPRLNAVTHYSNDSELYDAKYIKLKTLQIGYTFPKQWMQKAYIEKLRLFVSGENLLTITNFPGVDPEFGGSGFQSYPIPRMLSCGVNVTF